MGQHMPQGFISLAREDVASRFQQIVTIVILMSGSIIGTLFILFLSGNKTTSSCFSPSCLTRNSLPSALG